MSQDAPNSLSFDELLERAIEMLQRRQRLTHRAMKRQFHLDDDWLEDLKVELIEGQRVATEEGAVLIWTGSESATGNLPAPGSNHSKALPATADSVQRMVTRPARSAALGEKKSRAERRQLTVMFCDMVGSTRLSQELDPEDLREIIGKVQETAETIFRRLGGYVAQYLGDGILVYFGYPQAFEDAAPRAVRAGLGLIDEIAELNRALAARHGVEVAVRLGAHTGVVVIGEVGKAAAKQQLALGDTPNLAARIQSLAEPGTLVISQSVHQLVEGCTRCRDMGVQPFKGVSERLRLYRVIEATYGSQHGRHKVCATTLFGRRTEIERLHETWRLAQGGEAQAVAVSGEAGIGKSSLARSVIERAEGSQAITISCSQHHTNSALYPVIESLQRHLGFGAETSAVERWRSLLHRVEELGLPSAEVVPILSHLLSIEIPDDLFPELQISKMKRRQKTLQWLIVWLVRVARQRPLVIVWDDLQWADPTTLELIELLIEQREPAALFNLLVFRPEFRQPWLGTSIRRIDLGRLGRPDVNGMVRHLSGSRSVPVEVIDQILEKTDGVPLFVEEVTKLLLESSYLEQRGNRLEVVSNLPASAIPATLHDSLMARLDGLSVSREVAQLAATLGREFDYELIRAVFSDRESLLRRGLTDLVEADLLVELGEPPVGRYSFRHALIQDVAYQSLLKSTRLRYHHQIARVLEEQFAERLETEPELLAHHLTEAGLARQAVVWWRSAGKRSIERSAYREAVAHLQKSIALLQEVPETPERLQQELAVQTSLGVPLTAIKGYGAPEAVEAYERARELCEQLRIHQLFPVLCGLWRSSLLRARYSEGHRLGNELLELSRQTDNTSYRIQAHRSLGSIEFYIGEFETSLEHLKRVTDQQTADRRRSEALGYDVVDTLVAGHSYNAWNLWMLGREKEALGECELAIALSRSLDHRFTQALALSFAGWLHQFRRDVPAVREYATEACCLARDEGLEMWVGWNNILLGWSTAERGDPGSGVELISEGMASWRATGSGLGSSYFLALLAEAWARAERPEKAMQTLAEASQFAAQSSERFWTPELQRIRAGVEAQLGSPAEEVEAGYRNALELARKIGARALARRAEDDLDRLGNAEQDVA